MMIGARSIMSNTTKNISVGSVIGNASARPAGQRLSPSQLAVCPLVLQQGANMFNKYDCSILESALGFLLSG